VCTKQSEWLHFNEVELTCLRKKLLEPLHPRTPFCAGLPSSSRPLQGSAAWRSLNVRLDGPTLPGGTSAESPSVPSYRDRPRLPGVMYGTGRGKGEGHEEGEVKNEKKLPNFS
jgi:hypothetical protein